MDCLSYDFGIFRFFPESERLFAGDIEVALGHRALRVLSLLLERRGDIVKHRELIAHAWPESVVEDNNLRVQITAVRKVLREYDPNAATYLKNVAGRGYRFLNEQPIEVMPGGDASFNGAEHFETVGPSEQESPPAAYTLSKTKTTTSRRRTVLGVSAVREGHIGQARRFLMYAADPRRTTKAMSRNYTERTSRAAARQVVALVAIVSPDSLGVVPTRSARDGGVSYDGGLTSTSRLQSRRTFEMMPALPREPDLLPSD
jgi:DNA-binding winged helix-turn-helix (wHTH) protein